MTLVNTGEAVVYKIYDNNRQGREIWRKTINYYKWLPGDGFEVFVRETKPEAGKYLVTGAVSRDAIGNNFSIYEVKYPDFVIENIRSGGTQLYYDS